ncbi:hypothetical protein CEUSTIGMA_g5861.t1 [Chlamydomonas eustigma]|uniref:Protein kinase domain-containing protein n=1 Tax=Chlamydomonas eustigma TaxID=1157962 RepID=A0A250X661_9CHLO|nr:hypothetical protein CEUSTIGMA_g5861.t1 [Chlamydomonas eustigma]|eukprot:GAX78419.1 hypothetical protein CEUSTIGMA_g5861.t1 [Chlamydomonas eustigma]
MVADENHCLHEVDSSQDLTQGRLSTRPLSPASKLLNPVQTRTNRTSNGAVHKRNTDVAAVREDDEAAAEVFGRALTVHEGFPTSSQRPNPEDPFSTKLWSAPLTFAQTHTVGSRAPEVSSAAWIRNQFMLLPLAQSMSLDVGSSCGANYLHSLQKLRPDDPCTAALEKDGDRNGNVVSIDEPRYSDRAVGSNGSMHPSNSSLQGDAQRRPYGLVLNKLGAHGHDQLLEGISAMAHHHHGALHPGAGMVLTPASHGSLDTSPSMIGSTRGRSELGLAAQPLLNGQDEVDEPNLVVKGQEILTEGPPLAPAPNAARAVNASTTVPSSPHGLEIRLVLEYCDKGSLTDALKGKAFFLVGSGDLNYAAVLDTALDIAKAMLHLHLADVLHGDLKAGNVMLKSSGNDGRGLMAKVADFGMAVKFDKSRNQNHISNMYQGTLTHMAPELLFLGHMSKAADVYALGVTMWELYTSEKPFQGATYALLGHQIIHDHRRPLFPVNTPTDFAALAADCWAPFPKDRPSFEVILSRLQAIRGALKVTKTAPLYPFSKPAVLCEGAHDPNHEGNKDAKASKQLSTSRSYRKVTKLASSLLPVEEDVELVVLTPPSG